MARNRRFELLGVIFQKVDGSKPITCTKTYGGAHQRRFVLLPNGNVGCFDSDYFTFYVTETSFKAPSAIEAAYKLGALSEPDYNSYRERMDVRKRLSERSEAAVNILDGFATLNIKMSDKLKQRLTTIKKLGS